MFTVSTGDMVVNNKAPQISEALDMVDSFLEKIDLKGKKALHMRLLTEETLGMVGAMLPDYQALLHFEGDDNECRICLTAKTIMDADKKSELISMSTSGENAAVKGFMGKISDIIENGILNYDSVMSMRQEYDGSLVDYGFMGSDPALGMDHAAVWSLSQYRNAIEDGGDEVEEARDELEKSIVASIADEVTVGVKKDKVDMTIILKL
ncbi:MAG: hypothetical protein II799_00760 [Lachnospiraceae bacterium]|nr:hypothetical protein [Lachnospiraceae bacterium]